MNYKKIISNLSAYVYMQKQLSKIQDDTTLSDISKVLADDTVELVKDIKESEFSDSKCVFIIDSIKDFIEKIPSGSTEKRFYSVISGFFNTADPGPWEDMDVMLNNLWIIYQDKGKAYNIKGRAKAIEYTKKKCEELTGGKLNANLIKLFIAVLENGIDFVENVKDDVLIEYILKKNVSSLCNNQVKI